MTVVPIKNKPTLTEDQRNRISKSELMSKASKIEAAIADLIGLQASLERSLESRGGDDETLARVVKKKLTKVLHKVDQLQLAMYSQMKRDCLNARADEGSGDI